MEFNRDWRGCQGLQQAGSHRARASKMPDGLRMLEAVNIEEQAQTRLIRLDSATSLEDLRAIRGNRLEALSGTRKGQLSIRINDYIESAPTGKEHPLSKSPGWRRLYARLSACRPTASA